MRRFTILGLMALVLGFALGRTYPHPNSVVAAAIAAAVAIGAGVLLARSWRPLLAYVAVSKYADHLPLYRLEGILRRSDVELSRSTMCGWMAVVAELLEPIVKLMLVRVLSSEVVQNDATTVPVQAPARASSGLAPSPAPCALEPLSSSWPSLQFSWPLSVFSSSWPERPFSFSRVSSSPSTSSP